MCVSSKWQQLREDHSVKTLNWRLPTGILKIGKNISQTANKFQINQKQVRNEEKFRSLKRSKRHANMEKQREKELRTKFLDVWKEGKRVKFWWLYSKAKELVKEKYPDKVSSFKLSHRWFEGFCRRYRTSLQRKTDAAQK